MKRNRRKLFTLSAILLFAGLSGPVFIPAIIFAQVSQYTSRIVISPSTPADGTSPATAVVYVRDANGAALNKTVTLVTGRGSGYDTIIPVSQSSGAGGVCTFTIISPYVGADTVWATIPAEPNIFPNLVPNPSFEEGSSSPDNWSNVVLSGSPVFSWAVDDKRTGVRSIAISVGATDAGYWKSDSFQVSPNTAYRLSLYYKYKNSGLSSALVKIDNYGFSWDLNNATSWTYFEKTFTTTSSPSAYIHLELGLEDGQKIWFEDVKLERIPNFNFSATYLKFVTPAQTGSNAVPKDGPSDPIRVAAQDGAGNTDTYFTEPITLSSSSPTGRFSATSTPWVDIWEVSPVNGIATFYYKDSVNGIYTITVSRSGMNPDAQQIEVAPGPVKLDLGGPFSGSAGSNIQLTVSTRDSDGNLRNYTGNVNASSNSANGFLSLDASTWSKTLTITFTDQYSRIFYYRDDRAGNPTVTVSAADLQDTSQTGTINPSTVSAYASYLLVSPASIIANGINSCSVPVRVMDDYANPISGKNPSIQATLGNITNPPASNAEGWCTGSIKSANSGKLNTVTATVDAVVINQNLVYNPSFEYGDYNPGSNPSGWTGIINAGSPVLKWTRPNLTGPAGYAYSGGKAVYIYTPGSADSGKWISNSIPVEQGKTYWVEVWHRSSNSTGDILVRVDSGNSWYTSTSTNWKQLLKSFIAAGTSSTIELELPAGVAGKTVWFDCIRLMRVPRAIFTASKLVITSPPRTAKAGVPTDTITIEARDENNNRDINFNGTVNLSSSSGQGVFSLSRQNWINTNALTLSSGYGEFFYKDGQPGFPTITVSYPELQSGTQNETIMYGAIKLKFTSAPKTVRAGSPTSAITVEAQTDTGGADPNFNETVSLSTTGESGQFSTNLIDWSPYGANTYVQLISGTGNFYYRDRNFGTPVITVSHRELTPDTQVQTVEISRFVITTPQRSVKAGLPTDIITVEAQDENGHKDSSFSALANLGTSSNSGSFSLNQEPWVNISSINIWSGQASFYYKDEATGYPVISVSRTDTGIISGTQVETITFGAIKLKIITPPRTERAGWPVSITVQAQTNLGVLDTGVASPPPVQLATTSIDGHFSASSTEWIDINSIDLSGGQATFYYKDHSTGSPVITVSRTGLFPDTQAQAIVYGAIKFNITTPERTFKAGLFSDSIAVEALTDTNELDQNFSGTAVLSTSSNSGTFSVSNTQWMDTTVIKFSQGVAIFYYKDRLTGNPAITVSRENFISATQMQTVIYGAIKLGFTSPPRQARAGFPSDYISIAALTDTNDIDISESGEVNLITSSNSGAFSISSTEWVDITRVLLTNGEAIFYYRDRKTGTPAITVSRSGLFSGTQRETITYGAIKFAITTPGRTTRAGLPTAIIQAEARTDTDVRDTAFNGTATLLTSSSNASFSVSSTQWMDTTVITFVSGIASFYYKDEIVGNPTITITRADFYPGSQEETIVYGAIKLVITTPQRIAKAGASTDYIAVEAQTNMGVLDSSVGGTVVLGTSSGNSGSFSISSTQWNNVTVISLSGGYAAFYYKDHKTGNPLISVSRTSQDLYPATQNETIIYGAIKMKILTPPRIVRAGSVSESIAVQALTDTDAKDTGYNGQVSFYAYTPSSSGEFSFDSNTWSPLSITGNFSAGETFVYFRGLAFETGIIEVTNPDFASDTQLVTVTVSRLKITTPEQTTKAGYPTDVITVQAKDELGNVDYSYSGTIVLSTSSNTGFFSVNRFAWQNTTTILLSNGTASFYYKDNATGAAIITVSRQGLIADTQVVTIEYGASKLVIVTPPRTVIAGAVSESIAIQAQTNTGVLDQTVNGIVELYTSSDTGSFSDTNTPPWHEVNQINLVNGEGVFYYKDFKTGSPVITVSGTGLLPGTQTQTIKWGAVKLKIVTSPKTIRAGDVSTVITVWAQTCTGALDTTWPAGNTITLYTSGESGQFSLTGNPPWYPNGCTVTQVAGGGIRNFYYRDFNLGNPVITVCRYNGDLEPDSQMETITASRLEITSPSRTTKAGIPTDSITVEVQDENGHLDSLFSGTATLSTTSTTTGVFSVSRDNWVNITIITINNGKASFYYRDSGSGNPTITVSRAGLKSDSQVETILGGAIKLKFVSPVMNTKAGSPTNEIRIEAQSDTGLIDNSINCTVSLFTTSSSGSFSVNYSPWMNTTVITINNGYGTFYYIDYKTGQHKLSAYTGDLFPDTQIVNVLYGAIRLKIVTDTQTITPFSFSGPITAQAQTCTGALDTTYSGTITWTTDGPRGNFNTQPLPVNDPSWVNTGSITVSIKNGVSTIYYKDLDLGTKTLTVSWTGPGGYYLTPYSQLIRVQRGVPWVQNASASPYWFSPNADGWRDTSGISYYLKDEDDAADSVVAFVFDSLNIIVKTLVDTRSRTTGDTHIEIWNGSKDIGGNVEEGTYYAWIDAFDPSGLRASDYNQANSCYIAVDLTPPYTGSVFINNDAPFADTINVVLVLSSDDTLSGVGEVRVSNDDPGFGVYSILPYAPAINWTLAGADTRVVYVQFIDRAGNRSITYSDTIFVDTGPPRVIWTDPGNNETGVYYQDNIVVQFSKRMDTTTLNTSTIEIYDSYTNKVNFTISYDTVTFRMTLDPIAPLAYLVRYTVYIYKWVKDIYQNQMQNHYSWSFTTGIEDDTPPAGWVKINNDALYTNIETVTLNIYAYDTHGYVATIYIGRIPGVPEKTIYCNSNPFSGTTTWKLDPVPAGESEAVKTVYVWFDDAEVPPNKSLAFSDTIILDTMPPAVWSWPPQSIKIKDNIEIVFNDLMDTRSFIYDQPPGGGTIWVRDIEAPPPWPLVEPVKLRFETRIHPDGITKLTVAIIDPDTLLIPNHKSDGFPGYEVGVQNLRDKAGNLCSYNISYIHTTAETNTLAPGPVSRLRLEHINPGSIRLSWSPAVKNEDGSDYVETKSYIILRSQTHLTNYETVAEISHTETSYIDNTILPGKTYYYTVIAKSAWDICGSYQEEIDNKGNLTIMLPGETQTYVFIPGNAVSLLDTPESKTIAITATRTGIFPSEAGELGKIVGIFDFIPYKNDGTPVELDFAPDTLTIALHYIAPGGLIENTNISSREAAKYLGIAYWNGIQWVALKGTIDQLNQNLITTTTHLSRFAIIALNLSYYKVLSAEPNPFTPHRPPYDKVIFSFTNPEKSEVILHIFDITGTLVYTESYEPGAVNAKWDGRNLSGAIAEDGVYIYQIQAGTKFYTGTVILAK